MVGMETFFLKQVTQNNISSTDMCINIAYVIYVGMPGGFWKDTQNMLSSKNCNVLVGEEGSGGGLVKERFDFPIMLHFFPQKESEFTDCLCN